MKSGITRRIACNAVAPWRLKVRLVALAALAVLLLLPLPARSQIAAPPAYQQAPYYPPEELDQLVSPIALYPDALIAQILMASTYPLEVVQADRWLQDPANAALRGDALSAAMAQQPWAPSVKALVPFPQVLWMMDKNLDWTERLGNAFLAQEADIMGAIQRLRQRAMAAGTLVSTPQQVVAYEDQIIVIRPAVATVLYIPVYDPWYVYGPWPYPAYPPYYFLPPPGFYFGTVISGIGFQIGIGIVAPLWGWCSFDWHRRRVDVDVRRFNTINVGRPPITSPVWTHEPYHRRGVPYRDANTRARFERGPERAPETRRELRGYPARPPPTPPAPQRRPSTRSPTQRQLQQPGTAPGQPRLRGEQERERARPQQPQIQRQIQRPTQQPMQRQIQRPTQQPAQRQFQRPTQQPAQRQIQRPAQQPMQRQIQRPPQSPVPRAPSPAFQSFGPGASVRRDADRGAASRRTMPQQTAPRSAPPQRGKAAPSASSPGRGEARPR